MLFLFDNNGIDYWIHNNINDCCNPNVSHNTYQNVELEYKVETPVVYHELQMKQRIQSKKPHFTQHCNVIKQVNNNYKKTKNESQIVNHNDTSYAKHANNYNKTSKQYYSYNKEKSSPSCNKKIQCNNTRYDNIGSYEQPKLINL
jgi:hypothetical protein